MCLRHKTKYFHVRVYYAIQYAIGKEATSFEIPEGVIKIGNSTFLNSTNLTSISIPDSVTSIGNYAFEDCTSLATVYYHGTEAKWNAITIDSYNSRLTDAARYYYSETAPEIAGNWWHYDEDGNIAFWE